MPLFGQSPGVSRRRTKTFSTSVSSLWAWTKPVQSVSPKRRQSLGGLDAESASPTLPLKHRAVSPATGDEDGAASNQPVRAFIDDKSPASDVPSTWVEWNAAYRGGFIDFSHPPASPVRTDCVDDHNSWTKTGQYLAPRPVNEALRQRAVDAYKFSPSDRSPSSSSDDDGSLRSSYFNSAYTQSTTSSAPSTPSPSPTLPVAPLAASSLPPWVPVPPQISKQNGPPIPFPLARPKPLVQDGDYPALRELARAAKATFKSGICTISLMDRDLQIMLVEDGLHLSTRPRDTTICSHTLLSASIGTKEPLVVLNISEDWRFAENDFGLNGQGFYAAYPLVGPAPFGDTSKSEYPVGVFCVLDDSPRDEFSKADRRRLVELANAASAELARLQKQSEEVERARLVCRRSDFKRRNSAFGRRMSDAQSLCPVPEDEPLDNNERPIVIRRGSVAPPSSRPPKPIAPMKNPVASPATSPPPATTFDAPTPPPAPLLLPNPLSSMQNLTTTCNPPTFNKSHARGVDGVRPGRPFECLVPATQRLVDLATQVIAESLSLDFTYVIELDQLNKYPRIVSSYSTPPAPLFDLEVHFHVLRTGQSTLFVADQVNTGLGRRRTSVYSDSIDGDYTTGFLVRISGNEKQGFLLGGFSEEKTRVLRHAEFLFFTKFAQDLAKHTAA